MPECWLKWPIAIDGRPPTEEERKHAFEQLEKLENSADARKKNRSEIDTDGQKSAELMELLPDLFIMPAAAAQVNPILETRA